MTAQDMRLCRNIACVDEVTEVDPVGGVVLLDTSTRRQMSGLMPRRTIRSW